MSEPAFLTLDEVLGIHADPIRVYGGASGLRDLARLQSAIAMPETTFGGEYLHPSVFEMAAAYLFHLVRNHPFVDGIERTALMCALVCPGLNDEQLRTDPDDLYAPRARSTKRRCRSARRGRGRWIDREHAAGYGGPADSGDRPVARIEKLQRGRESG